MHNRLFSILLIEDDSLLGPLYEELLKEQGYNVLFVRSAAEAKDVVKQSELDVVLLDIMLPETSGLEYISELKQETLAPIVVLSNLDQENVRQKMFHLGATGYILKSEHTPESFLNMVKGYLKL
jgi:DNA-binding response OmpR family regulator